MWKCEGLQWHLNFSGSSELRYSDTYTFTERVTTTAPFEQVRAEMALAISRVDSNDEGFEDWSLGLDTLPSEINALTMSGVFGRIAIITSLSTFSGAIPAQFGVYQFGRSVADRNEKVFLPGSAVLA
jgi:hypothetical protein